MHLVTLFAVATLRLQALLVPTRVFFIGKESQKKNQQDLHDSIYIRQTPTNTNLCVLI